MRLSILILSLLFLSSPWQRSPNMKSAPSGSQRCMVSTGPAHAVSPQSIRKQKEELRISSMVTIFRWETGKHVASLRKPVRHHGSG